jgi:hypothetical protein
MKYKILLNYNFVDITKLIVLKLWDFEEPDEALASFAQ